MVRICLAFWLGQIRALRSNRLAGHAGAHPRRRSWSQGAHLP
jgi:hypothetical protein